MKKLFLFAGIMFFAFAAKAQEMNFEETVKYIENKLVNSTSEYEFEYPIEKAHSYRISWVKEVEFNKNGDVNIVFKYLAPNIKFNLFNISKTKEGILQIKNVVFFEDNGRELGSFNTPSTVDAERLYKAFLHLRTLCTKEKDPFD